MLLLLMLLWVEGGRADNGRFSTHLYLPLIMTPFRAISLEPVAEGFTSPTDMAHAGDGQLFVTEKDGRILTFTPDDTVPELFLDIQDRVKSDGYEQGLLGLAFHPDDPGIFFVHYTNLEGDVVISRFEEGENGRFAANGEQIILTVPQPAPSHNGGDLSFGPDGMLYIALGDGTEQKKGGNPAQDTGNLLGTILRIDVDGPLPYQIPPDNPFVGQPGSRGEIWAFGLRNPWRFSFDRETADLYIGDVGYWQWEEINVAPSGMGSGVNYGWRCYEGTDPVSAPNCAYGSGKYTAPTFAYYHAGNGGCAAIVGGYVYRGHRFFNMRGHYLFADFCNGRVHSLKQDNNGQWQSQLLLESEENWSTFGEGADGELYLAAAWHDTIYHIVPGHAD